MREKGIEPIEEVGDLVSRPVVLLSSMSPKGNKIILLIILFRSYFISRLSYFTQTVSTNRPGVCAPCTSAHCFVPCTNNTSYTHTASNFQISINNLHPPSKVS